MVLSGFSSSNKLGRLKQSCGLESIYPLRKYKWSAFRYTGHLLGFVCAPPPDSAPRIADLVGLILFPISCRRKTRAQRRKPKVTSLRGEAKVTVRSDRARFKPSGCTESLCWEFLSLCLPPVPVLVSTRLSIGCWYKGIIHLMDAYWVTACS